MEKIEMTPEQQLAFMALQMLWCTLKMNDKLNSEVVEGKNLKASDLYQRLV